VSTKIALFFLNLIRTNVLYDARGVDF